MGAGEQFTRPTLGESIAAFFVGNLFANFVLLVGAIYALSRAFGLEYWLLTTVVAYYAFLAGSAAPKKGGLKAFRDKFSPWVRLVSRYFDLQHVFDGELEPGSRYIFGVHPHGIHGFGTMAFMDTGSPLYERFPFLKGRVVGHVASVLFWIPLVREMFLAAGCRNASRPVVTRALAEGNSVYIIVGGEAESLLSRPGHDDVVAAGAKRKGIIRLALATKSPLVPVYMFHNTDTYHTSRLFYGIRKLISKRFQVALPLWWGRFFTPLPRNVRLTNAYGKPVPLPADLQLNERGEAPSAVVDAYHAAYISALQDLFEKHKAAAGYPPDRVLTIHESN